MANYNFLNPASFAPKLPEMRRGMLSGILRAEQDQDYRRLMQDQLALQKMGLEEAGIDLQQKKKGIPLQDLERTYKMRGLEGGLPYQGELGAAQARAGIETARMEETKSGPEARKRFFEIMEEQRAAGKYEQRKREFAETSRIIQYAAQLPPGQAQQYVKENYDKLVSLGYDMPKGILDSKNWRNLLNASVNSMEHIRAKEVEEERTRRAYGVADRQAAATRYAATQRTPPAPTEARLIQALVNNPPGSPEHESALQQLSIQKIMEADKFLSDGDKFIFLQRTLTATTEQEKEQIKRDYVMALKNAVQSRLRAGGVQIPNNTPGQQAPGIPSPQGTQPNNKDPLGLGL